MFNKLRFFRKKTKLDEDQIIQRGVRAGSFLNTEVYKEVVSELEEGIWQQFMATEADNPESREVLYSHIQALKNIHNTLEGFVQAAKLAEHNQKTKR